MTTHRRRTAASRRRDQRSLAATEREWAARSGPVTTRHLTEEEIRALGS